jgi:hypothetical protein
VPIRDVAKRAEYMAKYIRTYYEKNKDKIKETEKARYHKNPAPAKERSRAAAGTPKCAYWGKRANAKKRGIEFLLTFEEWWELWEPHWDNRGGKMLCRIKEPGPYAKDNVYIGDAKSNAADRQRNSVRT